MIEARRHGVTTLEINPGTSEVSHVVDHRLPLRSVEALSEVWARLEPRGTSGR